VNSILIFLLTIIQFILWIYSWIIIISALISWVQPNPYNPIVRFLRQITEPAYAFIRRYIPTQIGIVDLAPLILFFVVEIAQILIGRLIVNLAGGYGGF
jgi:YggT family protein